MNSANLDLTLGCQKSKRRRHLPDGTLEFPDCLPGFALRASAILFKLVQGLLGLDHPLCDELLLRQKLVLRPEEGLDDRRPCAGLDAAWDRSPGEEKEGDEERGSLERADCSLRCWF